MLGRGILTVIVVHKLIFFCSTPSGKNNINITRSKVQFRYLFVLFLRFIISVQGNTFLFLSTVME